MKTSLKLIALFLCLSFFNCKEKASKKTIIKDSTKEQWIKLFNGKDLSNWIVKIKGYPAGENHKNTFVVENGVLKVSYAEYDNANDFPFGHIFYKTPFSNYKLRLDYRFTGDQLKNGPSWAARNSGIMIHCEDPKTMGINQNFPVCVEVQFLGGLGTGERPTGSICTPGTHIVMNDSLITNHVINSSSKTFHGDQWVHAEVEVRNDSIIKHNINGATVISYSKPTIGGGGINNPADTSYWKTLEGKPLKKGYISLQSETHPVEFKNIELLEL